MENLTLQKKIEYDRQNDYRLRLDKTQYTEVSSKLFHPCSCCGYAPCRCARMYEIPRHIRKLIDKGWTDLLWIIYTAGGFKDGDGI